MKILKIPKWLLKSCRKKYPIFNPLTYGLFFCVNSLLKCAVAPFIKKGFKIVQPQKILLCNTAHLGDVILTTALLPVLKRALPHAKIGMLVGNWSLPLLEKHPLVDALHVVNHWKVNRAEISWLQKFKRYLIMRAAVKKELRKSGYHLAIDCSFHFPNMAYLLWSAKIPVRIGFESAGFSAFLTHIKKGELSNESIVFTFFSLLQDLNMDSFRHLLQPILPSNGTNCPMKAKAYIVIHMGSGDIKKNWVTKKWREVVERLIADGETLLFTGKGSLETREIASIIKGLPRTYNLSDQLSWSAFSDTLQGCALLISVDTSAAHLAASMNIPSILLYSGIHYPKTWAPFNTRATLLTHELSCSPCFKGCSKMTCMREITVDAVYQAVRSIKPRPTRPASSS